MQVGDYCDSPLQLQGIRKRLDRKHSSHRPTNDICPSCFLSGKTIFENEKRLKGKLNSPRFGNLPTDRHFRVVFSPQPNCVYIRPQVYYITGTIFLVE
nr:unnamed protein product [Callosobruchus chinensis]